MLSAVSAEVDPSLWNINRGPQMVHVATPLAAVSTLACLVRIAVRKTRSFGVGIDDWLILAALIMAWGFYTDTVLWVYLGGLGRPQEVNMAIDPNRFVIGRKILFAGELLYTFSITTVKLSILAMYRRLLPSPLTDMGSIILGLLSLAWWLAVVLVTVFQCKPQPKVFDPLGPTPGDCIDDAKFFVANSIPNIITDVLIICLPTYQIWKLRLPRSQRIAVTAVFLFGAGTTAVSIVRLHYHLVSGQPQSSEGFTNAMFQSALWTNIELNMAIICSCMPALRPLLTSFLNSRIMAPIWPYLKTPTSISSSRMMADHTIGGSPVSGFGRGRRAHDEEQTINSVLQPGECLSTYQLGAKSEDKGLSQNVPVEAVSDEAAGRIEEDPRDEEKASSSLSNP